MSTAKASHAFVYGRPVGPTEFLNREQELRTVFNRLSNGESSMIVGAPHIGKSSLLRKFGDIATQQEYLHDDVMGLLTVTIDLDTVGADYSPEEFWNEALNPLFATTDNKVLIRQLQLAAEASYHRSQLLRLFEYLRQYSIKLVLLLDEFDQLLTHPNFKTSTFFAVLRSITTRAGQSGGLVIVLACRLDTAQIYQLRPDLEKTGSPCFNHLIELRLLPFSIETIKRLLDRAGNLIDPKDRNLIYYIAGHHPFLLQAMAATLIETKAANHKEHAVRRFHERVTPHLDDLWKSLNAQQRAMAVLLSLIELQDLTRRQSLVYIKGRKTATFNRILEQMARHGLAKQIKRNPEDERLCLQLNNGTCWVIGSGILAWWVRDKAMANTHTRLSYSEWIADVSFQDLIDEDQWDNLVGNVRKFEKQQSDIKENPDKVNYSVLREKIEAHFDSSELRTLCLDLRIDYDNLHGSSKRAQVTDLVELCRRKGRTAELIAFCKRERPNISWHDVSTDK